MTDYHPERTVDILVTIVTDAFDDRFRKVTYMEVPGPDGYLGQISELEPFLSGRNRHDPEPMPVGWIESARVVTHCPEMALDLLREMLRELEDREDVEDGEDGRQHANAEMSLLGLGAPHRDTWRERVQRLLRYADRAYAERDGDQRRVGMDE